MAKDLFSSVLGDKARDVKPMPLSGDRANEDGGLGEFLGLPKPPESKKSEIVQSNGQSASLKLPKVSDKSARQQRAIEAWKAWKADPTPQAASMMLKEMQPDINRAVAAHAGTSNNPLLVSRAKLMALDAMERYDPNAASPSTYLLSQLTGLRRINRQQSQAVSVPERLVHEGWRLTAAEQEMQSELNRPPTDEELSLRTGLGLARMEEIRRRVRGEVSESRMLGTDDFRPPVLQKASKFWVNLVYSDLDETDQLILAHTLGLQGREVLQNQQLAKKLGISPGAVSQRKQRIQKLLDREQQLSPFLGGD